MSSDRYRIMVVDDEEDMRTLLQMTLSGQYEVFPANNGLDAMLKLSRYQPDLAIIDIMMPLMNGLDLAAKIRTTAGFQDLPLIALSALNSSEDIKKGYSAGADLYLVKPFQPERVVKNVEVSLRRRPVRHKEMTIAEIEERESRLLAKTKRAIEKKRYEESVQSQPIEEIRVAEPERPEVGAPPVMRAPAEQAPSPPAGAEVPSSRSEPEPPREERIRDTDSGFWFDEEDPTARLRILLVDDDADYLDIQRAVLEEEYEVVTAIDGLDAMSKIPEIQPDLFIIDGMMPKMSGYQLVDMIRGTLETRGIPIIFASAKGSERDRKMMLAKGVNAYLSKPFTTRELLGTISGITEGSNFRVRSKKRAVKDILYDEGKRRAEVMSQVDKQKRWETYGTLQGFLKQNKNKDAFDRD